MPESPSPPAAIMRVALIEDQRETREGPRTLINGMPAYRCTGAFRSMEEAVRAHDDFNILIEFHQEAQQPFNRELPELTAQHFGYVGLANAEQRGGLGLF